MKLRNQVLIGIGFVWIAFLTLTYAGSMIFLVKSYRKLEQQRATRDLERVNQALAQNIASLYSFASDWSHWDELYNYMLGKNPTFVPNNLNMASFVNASINLMSLWDKEGNLVFGTAIDTHNKALTNIPQGMEDYLYPKSLLIDRSNAIKDTQGLIFLNDKIMLIAACAITDGEQKLPQIGAAVFGRWLSTDLIASISNTTKLDFKLLLPDQIKQNRDLQKNYDTVTNNETGYSNEPLNEKTLTSYSLIRDIYNKPIGMLQMTTPRTLYLSGMEAIHYYLISFIALGIIFSALMIWLLRTLIIQRLERLNNDIADINNNQKLSQRVHTTGDDELTSVSNQINAMLDVIQASHEKLELRVVERTNQLQQSNEQLQQEITERKAIEKELISHKEHLTQLAHYDHLTSLPNRVFFNEMLNKSIKHANVHQKKLAILFVDLDRFKNINDALGHTVGDLVLKEIANRFSMSIRSGDVLARLGGDEFIILLNDITDPHTASIVAEKLLKSCSHPVKVNNHEFFLTMSIGICLYPDDGDSLEDLQRNADMAMYKAKHAGGNLFEHYTNEMNLYAQKQMQLEASLRKAIDNNEFVLFYQPKLTLKDGIIIGVEALIRWENPEIGLINPVDFIPLAEETGLISQIGEWALYEAARANKSWQDQGYQPITVAVNLSPKQFKHQNISDLIQDVLSTSKLPAQYLELEITESTVIEHVSLTITTLNTIKNMGLQIAIDDFGTGCTSINYLKQFPVSYVKIDQGFIKGIPHNQNDLAITSAIITLAHSLNIKVIAEGVETAEQLQFLADNECDIVQGYYLSRPITEAKLLSQLAKTNSPIADATA